MAIKTVQGVSSKTPVVYEAKYNDVSLLAPVITEAAKALFPYLIRAAGWAVNGIAGLFGRRRGPKATYIEPQLD